jgi:DNA recombination protein RmuC
MDVLVLLAGLIAGACATYLAVRPTLRTIASLRAESETLRSERAALGARVAALEQQSGMAVQDLAAERTRTLELTADRARLASEVQASAERLAGQTRDLEQLNARFNEAFNAVANRLLVENADRIQEQHRGALDGLLTPLREKLDRFERTVEQTHRENIRENQSLKDQIVSLQQLNRSIGEEARNLTSALKGQSKTQGNWGEVILERILEKSGLQRDREYRVQASHTGDDGRRLQPDVVLHLPEGKTLVIDAKVSLNAYERFCATEDETLREAALREHVLSVRRHIRELSEKNYHTLYSIASPDFVLMFIPIEPAFTLVVQHEPAVYDEAMAKNIVMVSQSTLMATVLTIASVWRREYQNQNAFEIARKAGDLYDKFVGFVEDMDDLGKRLQSADRSFDNAMKKLHTGRGSLVARSQELRTLGARTTKTLRAGTTEAEEDGEEPGSAPPAES